MLYLTGAASNALFSSSTSEFWTRFVFLPSSASTLGGVAPAYGLSAVL